MNSTINFIVSKFLTNPTILIGILVLAGYLLRKESAVKTITGTICAMVGLQLIIFGGSQFSGVFKPITEAVLSATGVQGYIMDSYAMKAASQEALGDRFGWMAYVYIIGFAVNILLVFFQKWTKAKGVFLTGNAATAHSQAMLWLLLANFVFGNITTIVVSGIILGFYWAYSTTLVAPIIDDVTEGGGFTVAHNQQLGLWLTGLLSPKLAGKNSVDCETVKLPGWLAIFNNNIASIAILMALFVCVFTFPTIGLSGIQELAGKSHWLVYLIMVGIQFSMYMVILLQGVRMLCAEITESFKGIQEKVVPDAIPGIDVAAILPFSPNAATLGFLFCTLGTVLSMVVLAAIKSPTMVLPGFTPLFFAGGPVGVVANKKGGIKAVIIFSTLCGIIQSFGSVWAISQLAYPAAVGWSGMFDLSSFWPALIAFLRIILKPFGLVI